MHEKATQGIVQLQHLEWSEQIQQKNDLLRQRLVDLFFLRWQKQHPNQEEQEFGDPEPQLYSFLESSCADFCAVKTARPHATIVISSPSLRMAAFPKGTRKKDR